MYLQPRFAFWCVEMSEHYKADSTTMATGGHLFDHTRVSLYAPAVVWQVSPPYVLDPSLTDLWVEKLLLFEPSLDPSPSFGNNDYLKLSESRHGSTYTRHYKSIRIYAIWLSHCTLECRTTSDSHRAPLQFDIVGDTVHTSTLQYRGSTCFVRLREQIPREYRTCQMTPLSLRAFWRIVSFTLTKTSRRLFVSKTLWDCGR